MLPAGVEIYEEHALTLDGMPRRPTVLAHALLVTRQAKPPLTTPE
jgi:hypothetical protein